MPNPATLKRFTQTCYLSAGVHNATCKILKMKIETFTEIDRYYVLCLDEMSLHLFYNSTRDKVIGFQDTGLDNCTQNYLSACSATVMLIRGIFKSWKQPLAYFFTNSAVDSYQLQIISFE